MAGSFTDQQKTAHLRYTRSSGVRHARLTAISKIQKFKVPSAVSPYRTEVFEDGREALRAPGILVNEKINPGVGNRLIGFIGWFKLRAAPGKCAYGGEILRKPPSQYVRAYKTYKSIILEAE